MLRRIGRVEECPDHAPGTYQTEPIGVRPAGTLEGRAKLFQRARQHEIDWIAGQAVPGNCEARYALARKDFQAHANDARQHNIGRYSIGDGQSQHGRQPVIGESEDKDDQPDREDAQPQDHGAAQ